MRRLTLSCSIVLGACGAAHAQETVLYDVTFDPGVHRIGLAPALDLGGVPRVGPSRLDDTEPVVFINGGHGGQLGALLDPATTGPSARSAMSFDVEDAERGVGLDFDRYRVEALVQVPDLDEGSLGPLRTRDIADLVIQIRRDDGTGFPNVVGFDPDGVISTNGNRPIGSYMSGARTRVAIEFSETTGKFAFYVDGELRSEDRFITGPFAEFERLYVSFADQFEPPSSMTIDDVRITGLPAACGAADLAPPFGVLDVSDVVKFLQAFGAENGLAHYADPIGTYDIADVVAFLASFGDGCD